MRERREAPNILLGLTGLRIDGGIASVGRCIARALDEAVAGGSVARADRVLLLEDAAAPAPAPRRGEQRLARGSQLRFVWEMWRSVRRHRPDLVLFDLVGLARSLRVPLPGLLRARVAICVHGLELEAARRGARARALQGAWRILANSRHTAQALGPALSRPEQLCVVAPCIDPERIALWERDGTPDPEAPREPAVLIVARMWSAQGGKGHDALLEAWPDVRARVPDARLWVAGAGDDRPRLEARAQQLGLGPAVRFLGRVPDAELGRLYRRAALFAMPSRQEGFGIVYAEAMWHGLPCIGSSADAAGEVIEAGRTGLLVPYGEAAPLARAIGDLLLDRERRNELARAAWRTARERFGYARFRGELVRALELGDAA